jgi:Protein of unknown function (DUF2608)
MIQYETIKFKWLPTTIASVFLSINSPLHAKSFAHIETTDYADIVKLESQMIQQVNASKLIIALDIDNTTLKTTTDLASEHWFLWQKQLLDQNTRTLPLAAFNVPDLLKIQGYMLQIAPMELVDATIPAAIKMFQDQGASVIALTSRSLDLRDATVRELNRNGIQLSSATKLGLPASVTSSFLPYDLNHLSWSGLTVDDAKAFELTNARPAVFESGVFLTDGQHKAVMLKSLLEKSSKKFDAILYVDDRATHIDGMQAFFGKRSELISTAHYTKTANHIQDFNNAPKDQVETEYCQFANGLKNSIYRTYSKVFFNTCE